MMTRVQKLPGKSALEGVVVTKPPWGCPCSGRLTSPTRSPRAMSPFKRENIFMLRGGPVDGMGNSGEKPLLGLEGEKV